MPQTTIIAALNGSLNLSRAPRPGLLEFTALLVQPQYWKDSQPPGEIEGSGEAGIMGGWMCLSLCINRGPTAHWDYDYYRQLILLNAAHEITTLLQVISTLRTSIIIINHQTLRSKYSVYN